MLFRAIPLALLLVAAAAPCAEVPSAPGEHIVDAMARQDTAALNAMIDVDALLERVIGDLDLPAASRAEFVKGFRKSGARAGENVLQGIDPERSKVSLVRSRQAGAATLQVVRISHYDEAGSADGHNYLEFEVGPDGRIRDWRSHAQCARASDTMRLLAASLFEGTSLLSSLFGRAATDDATIDAMSSLIDGLQRKDYRAAHDALDRFSPEFRSTMQWAGMRAGIASMFDEDLYRKDLALIASQHGRHPDVQFMLIDHFFYTGEYERMLASVQAFERAVATDGATRQLECTGYLLLDRFADAERSCREGTRIEPDFEPGWWTLVEVYARGHDAAKLLATLDDVESRFEKQMDPDTLVALEGYEWLASDPAFAPWAKARR